MRIKPIILGINIFRVELLSNTLDLELETNYTNLD